MLEKFLSKVEFDSLDDFRRNFHINVPDSFNFAYDVADVWAREQPNKRAVCWTNDQGLHHDYTFAEIKIRSDQAASFFQQMGIGHGDKVMLILKRRIEFWFCLLGLHKIGAIAVPATHLLTPKDLVYRNKAASIKMVVAVGEEECLRHVQEAKSDSPELKELVSVGPLCPEGWKSFSEGLENSPAFVRPAFVNNNDDISLLYFTSGTSGQPKMVAHDFVYPLGHIITAKYWHNLHPDSLHLTIADTGWAKAVWGKFYGQWICGACVFVYDHEKFSGAAILSMIERHKITSLCAPPTIFRFLIREDLTKYDLSSLEYCTIAGEPLNPSVYETFYKQTGIKMMEGFGQTETSLTIANFPWMEPKPGSMGIPNPAYDMDLITADGRSAEEGEQGEIVLKTDRFRPVALFKEYYRDPQRTREVYHDDIYHTGDVAWRDQDGYYWFVGRMDDVIKSSGYRIGPFEVESAVMTHPSVVECAITGVPDEIRGQVVKASIILAKEYRDHDKEALAKEIQEHVKQVTAPYKYPRVIEFVNELPKTISGKIRRVEIRQDDSEKINVKKRQP